MKRYFFVAIALVILTVFAVFAPEFLSAKLVSSRSRTVDSASCPRAGMHRLDHPFFSTDDIDRKGIAHPASAIGNSSRLRLRIDAVRRESNRDVERPVLGSVVGLFAGRAAPSGLAAPMTGGRPYM